MGHVHCLRDPQVRKNVNLTLKLDLTVLFTHLKFILRQYFQFSVISNIQIDPYYFFFPNHSEFMSKITVEQL